MTQRGEKGFSVVELMLVVTIIAVLAAIAMPALQQARSNANEGSAVSSLRTIISSNQLYRTRFGRYAATLPDMGAVDIIDSVLANAGAPPGKSGFLFTYAGGVSTWTVRADPIVGAAGNRHFFADESGVIRFAHGTPAQSTDPPID